MDEVEEAMDEVEEALNEVEEAKGDFGDTFLSSTSQAQNPALVTSKAINIEKAIVESSNTFVR